MLKAKSSRRERKDKEEAVEEIIREVTTRLNAEIPISLHQKLKILATKQRKSVTEILIDLIHEYLKQYSIE